MLSKAARLMQLLQTTSLRDLRMYLKNLDLKVGLLMNHHCSLLFKVLGFPGPLNVEDAILAKGYVTPEDVLQLQHITNSMVCLCQTIFTKFSL